MGSVISVFMEEGRGDSSLLCPEKSLTKQSFSDECNINKIIAKLDKTGCVTHVNQMQQQYGDFSGVTDYHTAIMAVHEADEMFMQLPADIRKRFNNDPGELLAFVQDPKNREEGLDLGLFEPTDKEAADRAAKAKLEASGGQAGAAGQVA